MYRPCNQAELDLVAASGYRQWPPRLATQPIFYPVTNIQYAREVNAWNVQAYGLGYVTRFAVRAEFVANYPVKVVGAGHHTEWWIPSEERLNDIVGLIEVVESVSGERGSRGSG